MKSWHVSMCMHSVTFVCLGKAKMQQLSHRMECRMFHELTGERGMVLPLATSQWQPLPLSALVAKQTEALPRPVPPSHSEVCAAILACCNVSCFLRCPVHCSGALFGGGRGAMPCCTISVGWQPCSCWGALVLHCEATLKVTYSFAEDMETTYRDWHNGVFAAL